jgi:hypothetical protein
MLHVMKLYNGLGIGDCFQQDRQHQRTWELLIWTREKQDERTRDGCDWLRVMFNGVELWVLLPQC